MAANWGLAGGGTNALQMFQVGAQLGGQVRERRDAQEKKNALTDFLRASGSNATGGIVATPEQQAQSAAVDGRLGTAGVTVSDGPRGADAAYQNLITADPEMAFRLRGDMEKRQREARVGQLQTRAAQGDTAALGELAGVDINAWNTLSDQQLAVAKQGNEAIGNAALAVSQVPEAQRAAAWDSYIGELARQYPQLAQYQGRYSPQALEAVIAQAGYTKQLIDLRQPSYQAVPYDSTLVNTRDPNAVAAFAGGTPPQQGAQQQAGAAPEAFTGAQIRANIQSMGAAKAVDWMRRNNIMIQVENEGDYSLVPNGFEYIAPDGTRRRKGGQ